MKAILVEDETIPRQHLGGLLLRYFPGVSIVGEAADAATAEEMIYHLKPDLVFLDIEMPGRSGLEMLAGFPELNFAVIFVTAHNQYALQAIKMSALDYLLKPVAPSELSGAIRRAEKQLRQKYDAEQLSLLQANLKAGRIFPRIALPLSDRVVMVDFNHIVRCECENNYTRFHLSDGGKLLISKGIYEYEKELSGNGFLRCHHSHMVNLVHVKSVIKTGTNWELEVTGGFLVPVSRMRKEEVKLKLL